MSLETRVAKLESRTLPADPDVMVLCFVSPNTPKPEPVAYSTGFGRQDWRCEREPGESAEAHLERAKTTMPGNPCGGRVLIQCHT